MRLATCTATRASPRHVSSHRPTLRDEVADQLPLRGNDFEPRRFRERGELRHRSILTATQHDLDLEARWCAVRPDAAEYDDATVRSRRVGAPTQDRRRL